jgi:hypothetical protein
MLMTRWQVVAVTAADDTTVVSHCGGCPSATFPSLTYWCNSAGDIIIGSNQERSRGQRTAIVYSKNIDCFIEKVVGS